MSTVACEACGVPFERLLAGRRRFCSLRCALSAGASEGPNGCVLWTGSVGSHGYGDLRFRGRHYTVHRASWELASGEPLGGRWCLHRCDVKLCMNPAHLYAGSRRDNARDAFERGQLRLPMLRGASVGTSRLSEDQVVSIRTRFAMGDVSQVSLAEEHGVSGTAIHHVVTGIRWRHAGGPITSVGRGQRPRSAP